MKKANCFLLFLFLVIILAGCSTTPPVVTPESQPDYPRADREFRAAWVATVANINWPSRPGLPVEAQQAEAIELLDLLQAHNFNAVIFQARPQCDALYPSELEPWSYYLTGEQGKAPEPYYDPLEFWVNAAHDRGLELHVWVNPYRAHHVVGGPVSEHSVVEKHPELVVKLKSGYWWLDPSLAGTRAHSQSVILDLVRRYDIDGVHMDDYFYPYPSYNDNEDFPDDQSWAVYQQNGGELSRSDWRREGVNIFIKELYAAIKAEKPHVKFGLSPFGIWRPNFPPSIAGFDQYEELYADAKLWLNEGWVDYFTPQLYWKINKIPQSYPVLLGWWDEENTQNRHLWPGINISRDDVPANIDETINQIMVTRGILPKAPGTTLWSIGPLVRQPELVQAIAKGPYAKPALVPPSPWLDATAPAPPQATTTVSGDTLVLRWMHPNPDEVFHSVVYYQYGSSRKYQIFNRSQSEIRLPLYIPKPGKKLPPSDTEVNLDNYVLRLGDVRLTAVDRTGNESEASLVPVEQLAQAITPKPAALTMEQTKSKQKKSLARVKLGIEVLVTEQLDLISGKRVGLITNPSAVGPDLRSDIDILANTPGVELTALFGAEHGVRGARHGKIIQEGELDSRTGIPVYSLYADSFAPRQEWLDQIDVMIFDIQGVGSSWYTFKYSMSFAMEACAKAGIPFIVLDRPNPLGGEIVEGPNLDLGSIFRHPLPLRHGMTYGELATMWNDTENFSADLTVVKMKGWRRHMMWDDTGLFWVMPSPNMGTFETAVVYPGQCLFERMNIAEARGTTKPFLITGAPWINAEQAAADLNQRNIPGAIFRPAYFIPQRGNVSANPRNKPWNQLCAGVEIMLTEPDEYHSVAAALHIIDAYRRTSPDSFKWHPPEIIQLLDQPEMSVEDVVKACQEQVQPFIELREKYFLY